jgi:hypothetical protein
MALKHTHSWVQLKRKKGRRLESVMFAGEQTYICAHPDCGAKRPRSEVLDKTSCCPVCTNNFLLDWKALLLVTPVCMLCRNDKEANALRNARELISDIVSKSLEDKGDDGNAIS